MPRFPRLRKYLRRAAKAALGLFVLWLCLAAVFAIHCSQIRARFQPSPHSSVGSDISGYARPEDDSFLTYAEWYIVWSYQEKGAWQQNHAASGFPYFGAIGQYWSGYCCSYSVVRDKYSFNFGDHLMLSVIGSSFTVEYALKGLYENTLGRFSEWTAGHEMVPEDKFAAQVANDYGAFVADRPFYEFRFFHALAGLWHNTDAWGPHAFRKWERKLWLSTDYLIEGIYCSAIEILSHATYGVEEDVTYAVIEHAPESLYTEIPAIRKIKEMQPGLVIVKLPRYRKFTETAQLMFRTPARFVTIAGNGQIMLTALLPSNTPITTGEVLFALPLLTNPGTIRVAIRTPVAHLDAAAAAVPIEHIYDY